MAIVTNFPEIKAAMAKLAAPGGPKEAQVQDNGPQYDERLLELAKFLLSESSKWYASTPGHKRYVWEEVLQSTRDFYLALANGLLATGRVK